MRAAVAHRFGPPSVLGVEVVADAAAARGEVVIAVEFASITFVETQVRAGHPPNPAMVPALPFIPGNGVGGTVTQLGEGVDPDLLGRKIVATTGGRGGYAERVAVEASQLIAVPFDLPLDVAVALLADGRTALALMQMAAVRTGESVLIEAAAGGVGACLVQLAAAAGARVVACASSADKLAAIEGLGADVRVDYSREGWAADLRSAGEQCDVVFDGVGGTIGAQASTLLRRKGRLIQFGMASGGYTELPSAAQANDLIVLRGLSIDPVQARNLTKQALAHAVAGVLTPVIGQVFPLEQVAEAHAVMEARTAVGKTLLSIDPSHPQ